MGLNKVLLPLNDDGDPSFLFQILINRQSLTKISMQVLFQWIDLNNTKDVYHLFFSIFRIRYSLLVILDDQVEISDHHTKLICCNMYREENV